MAMKPADDAALRRQLVWLLESGDAHATFENAVRGFPARLRGVRPEGAPYTGWQLLEHMRIAQWDILEFSRRAKHKSPKWPEGYWPKSERPPSAAAWTASVRSVLTDRRAMQKLVTDRRTDLFAPIPWGDGQTILREALLAADHNAYHLGQVLLVRKLLGAWGE